MSALQAQWFFGEEPLKISAVTPSLWRAVFLLKKESATHIEMALRPRQRIPARLAAFEALLEGQWVSAWQYGARKRFWGKVLYLRYVLAEPLQAFVQGVPTLWDWMDTLPEDPALYEHSRLLVWTISHEGYVFARLEPEEVQALASQGFALEACDTCPERVRCLSRSC